MPSLRVPRSAPRRATSGVVVKGKIRYIPPQQALGLPIDRRADIWNMGALLYMGLVGETPYPGDNDLEVLRAIISGAPPAPLPSTVPEPISRVIGKCLQHAPSARYATALELRTALEASMIDASTPYSIGDVAAHMREHTGHRVTSRRQALKAALAVVDDAMLPVDVISTSAAAKAHPLRPIGKLAIAVGALSVVAAAVIILSVRSPAQTKSQPAPVSSGESAFVPVLARPAAASPPPTVAVASATVAAPRRCAPRPKARGDASPANSGLGSAIDSRK